MVYNSDCLVYYIIYDKLLIEKWIHDTIYIVLLNTTWNMIKKMVCELILLLYIKGVLEELWLVGVFHITFTIDNLEGERIYIVSLNISICFDNHIDCYMSAQILKHTRLPKELCKYDTQYSIRGKYPHTTPFWNNLHQVRSK